MNLRMLPGLLLALVAILIAAPASAQVYKWVDERGVTNYSNQPPAVPRIRKVSVVESKISVYSTDPALADAVAAYRQQRINSLAERIASLERELETERQARQYASAVPVQLNPCLGSPAINCGGIYGNNYPVPVAAFSPGRTRPLNIVQAQLPPGAIAGNVVGMNGFTAGMSASASRGGFAPFRPGSTISPSLRFTTR